MNPYVSSLLIAARLGQTVLPQPEHRGRRQRWNAPEHWKQD